MHWIKKWDGENYWYITELGAWTFSLEGYDVLYAFNQATIDTEVKIGSVPDTLHLPYRLHVAEYYIANFFHTHKKGARSLERQAINIQTTVEDETT